MKQIRFYRCAECGNLLTSTGKAELSCCGRKLSALELNKKIDGHQIQIQIIEDEFYITFDHEMTKVHYMSFIAYVTCDRVFLIKLYPEQGNEVRMPRLRGGKFYYGCNKHGLFAQNTIRCN